MKAHWVSYDNLTPAVYSKDAVMVILHLLSFIYK